MSKYGVTRAVSGVLALALWAAIAEGASAEETKAGSTSGAGTAAATAPSAASTPAATAPAATAEAAKSETPKSETPAAASTPAAATAEVPKADQPKTETPAQASAPASAPSATAAEAAKSEPSKSDTPTSAAASSSSSPAATAPAATAAEAPKAEPPKAETPAATATSAPASEPDAVVPAVRTKLGDAAAFAGKFHADDLAALAAFYGERSGGPLWVSKDGLTAKGKALAAEIKKADDWGLEASAFDVPAAPASGAAPDALADAEVKLSLSALKYARFARGGRTNPRSLSRILDMDPQIRDPKVVFADLAKSDTPDAVLRDLNPKHEQFQRLREALLKLRGPQKPEEEVDPALKVKLPQGKSLKPGADNPDIALLRQRLKIPADAGAKETVLDDKLAEALKAFQLQKGLTASGTLTAATRQALNEEGSPKKSAPEQEERRLVVNMEKWRWMPDDLGKLYIMNNVPEFMTRMVKDGKEIFKEKIIAGQPAWATPTFSAEMQFVVFNPSWGVPDGIKQRELLPRLQRAGGGGFFEQLFGGGGGGAAVLKAYGLTAYKDGKAVDPESINWSSTDIRSYSFTQPPGGKNPLGMVKFRFPNKHDVYMHDTTQRELFAQSYRALSHGCMRVQNPRRLADLILAEDRGISLEEAAKIGGGDLTLQKPFPVHVTYFTAMVDENGKVQTFGDIYGHDSKISAALGGKVIYFDTPAAPANIETASTDVADPADAPPAGDGKKKGKGNKKKPSDETNDLIGGALSGLVAN